jgi:hypothetical protein
VYPAKPESAAHRRETQYHSVRMRLQYLHKLVGCYCLHCMATSTRRAVIRWYFSTVIAGANSNLKTCCSTSSAVSKPSPSRCLKRRSLVVSSRKWRDRFAAAVSTGSFVLLPCDDWCSVRSTRGGVSIPPRRSALMCPLLKSSKATSAGSEHLHLLIALQLSCQLREHAFKR